MTFKLPFFVAPFMLVAVGCGRARAPAPAWDPPAMTKKAFELLDADQDGQLSQTELEGAPGLKYSLPICDTDGDQRFSQDELLKRLKAYQDSRLAFVTYELRLQFKNRALPGARVRLVPEPFLGGVVEIAEGISDASGLVRPVVPSRANDPGLVRVGFYRVEVTSDSVKIAPKYNTETTLGVEVTPFTNPLGVPTLDVGKN